MNNNSCAMNNKNLDAYSKEELIKIIEIYSKSWACNKCDGVWFQSIERKFGMEEAMYHDGRSMGVNGLLLLRQDQSRNS